MAPSTCILSRRDYRPRSAPPNAMVFMLPPLRGADPLTSMTAAISVLATRPTMQCHVNRSSQFAPVSRQPGLET